MMPPRTEKRPIFPAPIGLLAVVGVCPVFPVIMLILQLLGSRFHIGIDPLTAAGHLGHLFENNSVVNGFKGIFSQVKGPWFLQRTPGMAI